MKSTLISREGSPFNIDPFNLDDVEAWNRTMVTPSGTGMSFHLCQLSKQYINEGATYCIFDKGLTRDKLSYKLIHPFN